MSTALLPTQDATRDLTGSRVDAWWLAAAVAIVASMTLSSLFSPDLVTGSQQEHLPVAGLIDWLWGGVALGYLAFLRHERCDPTVSLSIIALWCAVAATSIFAPEFVTGTDPTRIPLAALVAPVVGVVGTAFLTLHGLRQEVERT